MNGAQGGSGTDGGDAADGGGSSAADGLTYPCAGATAHNSSHWPAGYRPLHVRTPLGSGEAVFHAAARAVLEWRMQRAMGVVMETGAPRAAPGVRVDVGLGPGRPLPLPLRVHAPCRVVWTVSEERRAGWAYGTLPGHPVRGEEAFLVSWDRDDSVRLDVTSFSRTGAWWVAAAGPLLPFFQRWYARRCGSRLRALLRAGAEDQAGREKAKKVEGKNGY